MANQTPLNIIQSEGNPETATANPSVKLDEEVREEILSQVLEEGMVIVHCTYHAEIDGGIRIWRTTLKISLSLVAFLYRISAFIKSSMHKKHFPRMLCGYNFVMRRINCTFDA
jgi:hypothetical protein